MRQTHWGRVGPFLLALFCVCVAGCSDEVARVLSPDSKLEAVLFETNGGATTSFGYNVYVVQPGVVFGGSHRVADFYGATRSRSAYGVNLRWEGPTTLVIEYLRAREANLPADVIHVGDRDVRVVLREGIEDPEAPPGGMLYNLRGRPYDRVH